MGLAQIIYNIIKYTNEKCSNKKIVYTIYDIIAINFFIYNFYLIN